MVVTQSPINEKYVLILYGREGCCLCAGLEQRLRSLSLDQLEPPLELRVIDIDGKNISNETRSRYDLLVPVMLLATKDLMQLIELPRVSPRLNGESLFNWLQKTLWKTTESN